MEFSGPGMAVDRQGRVSLNRSFAEILICAAAAGFCISGQTPSRELRSRGYWPKRKRNGVTGPVKGPRDQIRGWNRMCAMESCWIAIQNHR